MYSLSKCQVQQIAADVENARITFSHLADDLIDHICCEVENEMYSGKSFDEAYEDVKQQVGIKTLQKIQENTQYLIDKNYRLMKMTMKITGNVSLALLALATVMKILHLPGAGILLLFGFLVLGFVFFPSALYTNYKDLKGKTSLVLHLSMYIGGLLFMFGVLFKVMHWPWAGTLLLLGWVFILFVFLPLLLIKKYRESETTKEKLIVTTGVIGLIIFELSTMFKIFHWPGAAILMVLGAVILVAIFLPFYTYSGFKKTMQITGEYIFVIIGTMFFILLSVLLALNVSKNVLGTFVKDANSSGMVVKYLETKSQKIYSDFAFQPDSVKSKYGQQIATIQSETDKLINLIDSIKIEIVVAADEVDKTVARELIRNAENINNKSSFDAVNRVMVGSGGLLFKQQIQDYRNKLAKLNESDVEYGNSIQSLLSTDDIMDNSMVFAWEDYTFRNQLNISAISILNDIEKRVRIVESQSIGHYLNK